jgi:hypothetical protein
LGRTALLTVLASASLSPTKVTNIITRIPADSETKLKRNHTKGHSRSNTKALRGLPASNAINIKYGKGELDLNRVPSRLQTKF